MTVFMSVAAAPDHWHGDDVAHARAEHVAHLRLEQEFLLAAAKRQKLGRIQERSEQLVDFRYLRTGQEEMAIY